MSRVVASVTPEQLHAEQLAGKSPALADVRTAAEFRAGHIPGAQLIPCDELSSVSIDNHMGRSGLGSDETLYITCQAGLRPARAAETLRPSGLTNVELVEGDMHVWKQAGTR
jgi:rhodanese-related sulfurtransferase